MKIDAHSQWRDCRWMILVSDSRPIRFMRIFNSRGSLERWHQITVGLMETTVWRCLVAYLLGNFRCQDPHYYLSNAMHSRIWQNIKSLACLVSGVRCPVCGICGQHWTLWCQLWTDLHQIWNVTSTYGVLIKIFSRLTLVAMVKIWEF